MWGELVKKYLQTKLCKFLNVRLNSFITSHNTIGNRQYGFRKGRSTNDALIKLLDQAYKTINDNAWIV